MFSDEAEKSVLGAILIKPECLDDITLAASDFYAEANRVVFSAIMKLHAKGREIDTITVSEQIGEDLKRIGGMKYVGGLMANTPSASNVKVYAGMVRERSLLRQLQVISQDIYAQAENKEPAQSIAEGAESQIFAMMQMADSREPVMLREALEEAIISVEQRYSGASIALETGLDDLNELLGGGFHKGSLNVLAARPKMGKTALACSMTLTAATAGAKIYFASLEMPRREIASRMIAIRSGHPASAIMNSHEAMDAVTGAISTLEGLQILIDDEVGISVGKLRSRVRKMARKHGLDMIVVDYLQLMKGEGNNREQEIASISRGLKGLAKEMDCPVLCLAQVNRECESRQDKRPHMSDLRESGAIEADADLVMMIYRDEVYNKDSDMKGVAEILVRANRHGACGEIYSQFQSDITRFMNLDKHWHKPEQQKRGRGF